MDKEDKADALIDKVEKKLNSFSLFTSQAAKLEEAEEVYTKAANMYKVAKNWEKAGETFKKLAEVSLKLDNQFQAAGAYTDASKALKKSNAEESVRCLERASEVLTDIGKFSNAAKVQKEIGEALESEGDKEGAIKHYETAADYYQGENMQSQANDCRLLAAALYALVEKYDKAIEVYEQVGMESLDSNLRKFSVKDYFFRAGLCHFCQGDLVGTERSLQKYGDWDVSFPTTREGKLLNAILEAHKTFEVDDFTAAVQDYDSISKLDSWATTILLRIKNALKSDEPIL